MSRRRSWNLFICFRKNWLDSTWTYTLMIAPLLLGGVLIAGFLLGMPGSDNGIIPSRWIAMLVGGNSLGANFFASVVGAFMYFATLTEVPIVQGLLGSGMGKGPSLALLLAGPALSLPNMIVIRSILGTKKAVAFISYVIILSTVAEKDSDPRYGMPQVHQTYRKRRESG